MRSILMLAAVTRANRHAVMGLVNDAIMGLGGWVDGHSLYGNMVTVFRFEVDAARLRELETRLDDAAVHLDDASREALAGADPARGDMRCALNVTFVHNEPDVKRPVPAVPG